MKMHTSVNEKLVFKLILKESAFQYLSQKEKSILVTPLWTDIQSLSSGVSDEHNVIDAHKATII